MSETNLIALIANDLLTEEAKALIIKVEQDAKEADERKKRLREELLAAMEEHGIKSFNDEKDGLKISYVEGSDRETFDKKALMKDMPEVYAAYVDFKPCAPSIRVTVK